MNLAEVFTDPQVLAQEMVLEVEHPDAGPVRMTGFPVNWLFGKRREPALLGRTR